jgi:hypothetical protein
MVMVNEECRMKNCKSAQANEEWANAEPRCNVEECRVKNEELKIDASKCRVSPFYILHSAFYIFFLFSSLMLSAAEVEFRATTSPQTVSVGESFYLTYTLNAAGTNLRLPALPDFDLLTPQPEVERKYSTQSNNGTVERMATYTYRYTLRTKKEGTLAIAPATVTVGTKQYRSNAVSLQAGKAQQHIPSDQAYQDVFVRIIPSKTSLYEQEAFLLTYKLYAAKNNFQDWHNISYPDTKGFIVREVDLNPNRPWIPENFNRKKYGTLLFKQQILQAQQSGKLSIGQGSFEAVLELPAEGLQANKQHKSLLSEPLSINVKPLPDGKPASFQNAVGNFKMMSEISSAEPRANEAFSLKITVSGKGNLQLFGNPAVSFPDDFEIFEPKTTTQIEPTAAGISGSRTIEYLAIPRSEGQFVIPPVEFSFFNPATGKYQTLRTQEYKVKVLAGDGRVESGERRVEMGDGREEMGDSREETGGDRMQEVGIEHLQYRLYILLPLLGIIAFFVYFKRKTKKNSQEGASLQSKETAAQALLHLKAAEKSRKEGEDKNFYAEVLKALRSHLSASLHLSPAELSRENIEEKLKVAGKSETKIKQVLDTLQTAEMMRYAPAQSSDKMDELYRQTTKIIKNDECKESKV